MDIKYLNGEHYNEIGFENLDAQTQELIKQFLGDFTKGSETKEADLRKKHIDLGYSDEEIQTWIEASVEIRRVNVNNISTWAIRTPYDVRLKTQHTTDYAYAGARETILVHRDHTKEQNEIGTKIQAGLEVYAAHRKAKADAEEMVRLRSEVQELRERLSTKTEEEQKEKE